MEGKEKGVLVTTFAVAVCRAEPEEPVEIKEQIFGRHFMASGVSPGIAPV